MTKTCPDCHATVLSTSQPERMDEVLRLLRKISDLAYDEDVGEPLDCAIDYANKAIAALAATPAFEINPFANEPAATPVVGGERKALEIGRQEIVLAIAFLGRDNGTHRMPNSVQSLIKRLAIADKAILAALRAPPASPLRGREEMAKRLDNMARYQKESMTGKGRFNNFLNGNLVHEAAAFIRSASPPEQPAAGLLEEGIEILDNLLASIRKHGNYSAESTITFIDQSLQCFRAAAPKPWIDAGEGDMS